MRTIIDIAEPDIRELDALARRQSRSRAAVIREAIEAHLARHDNDESLSGFGLWRDVKPVRDGLDYQERMRAEW